MKDWYEYRSWNLTHRDQLRESRHKTYHTTALIPNSCGPMADGPFRDPKSRSYPHSKYWTHRWRIDINIGHGISPFRAQLRESRHMTYHKKALLPNSCSPLRGWSISGPQGSVLSTPEILDPSMKDWYQYWPCNLIHRAQWRESRHMIYHTTALLPNSCGPMADGPFRDPKGRSYPHSKYWTHWWRIDINIGHGISPIESIQDNLGTWHIIRRHYT